ncbi:hypothetical protein HMPREF9946_01924 [Acetobacteraceae bacterium AT-5844]|nr:hypothetical protein HMPREF9946_01924 [Acetobacteraceae bacterium AT-5844]
MRDSVGNMPPLPGIFPDYPAPIVRTAADGVRELAMARWGMVPRLGLRRHEGGLPTAEHTRAEQP